MAAITITAEWVEQLLGTPTLAEQTTRVQSANLLNSDGLAALLNEADRLLNAAPHQAEQLILLSERLAEHIAAAPVLPQAAYWRAMCQVVRGEYRLAQTLIAMAHAGYTSLGMTDAALHTNVGLISVLGEAGEFERALQIGETTLRQIGLALPANLTQEPAEYTLLAAKLYLNCGNCYEYIGQYEQALAAYTAARQHYAQLGMQDALAQVMENSAVMMVSLGQVQAALPVFTAAQQIYAQEHLGVVEAQMLINIGEAHLLLGNFTQSLQAFNDAAQRLETLGETVERYILWRHTGDAYLALNLYGEALDAYRQARQGLQTKGFVYFDALALWGMGTALAAQAQPTLAQQLLSDAAQQFHSAGNTPLLATVMLEQANLHELVGETVLARTLASKALQLVAESNWNVQKIYAYLRNADLALPDTTAAEIFLRSAEPLVGALGLPHLRYRLDQRLGHVRLLQGADAEAQRYLEQAVAEIERLRSTLVQERLRASFLADKITAYQDLVQLHLKQGNIQQAFALTERAKSRALVDLLSGVIQSQLDQPADPTTTQQLQELQADLNAIYNEMLTGNANENLRTADISILQHRALELEQTISRLRLQPGAVSPRESAMSAPALPSAALWQALAPDQALVVYHMLGSEIIAFVCVNRQIQLVRQLSSVAQVQPILGRLTAQWERARVAQPFLQRHLVQLQQATQRLLHTLYLELMAPIWSQLEIMAPLAVDAVRQLVIVPHALLHQLPFHALHDGERYLVERCAISYAPSATVFALCQQRTRRRTGTALAIGVPDERIPAVAQEVQRVASRLQAQAFPVQTHLHEAATVAALTELAPHSRLLHLACHGLFRGDNPMFSALKLHDGWLTAAAVAQFDLTGALVTLSACESGRSQVIGGDEILGLTYAFLSAGAATLVVSQWLVQDQVTAQLMEEWYGYFAECNDAVEALRCAQLTVMARYPHPYYWAPFFLVGQRASGL